MDSIVYCIQEHVLAFFICMIVLWILVANKDFILNRKQSSFSCLSGP